jgi:uncharacterized protein YfaS (alpha-2-macroglobulin family)
MKRALLLLALTFTLCGQADDEQPFFSLSSARTFAPGEKPTVELSAVDVAALDFRIYRVKDPVAFFGKLEDAHNFGGQAQRPPRELTAIERFHRFKRSWHSTMRNTFREQFSNEAWADVRTVGHGKNDEKETGVTNFAAAPLLNSQQVVATWRQRVQSEGRWRGQSIGIDVKEEGVYLVEAARGDLRAYTILMVTDLGVISKSSEGKMVAFVANRRTGEPVQDCTVLVQEKKPAAALSQLTDANGLANFTARKGEAPEPLLLAYKGASFAASSLSGFSIEPNTQQTYTGYTYTDRPVYRPGHPVHFRSILRTRTGNVYHLPKLQTVSVEVQGPDEKTIYRKQLPVSAMGTVAGDLTLPSDAGLGYYSVQLHAEGATVQAGFEVEEYKKPEYEVRVSISKPRVLQGDSLTATVDARYFFGEPVANATLHYVVFRSRYWYPVFQNADESEEAAPEGEGDAASNSEDEQISDEEAKLNSDGKFTFTVKTAVSDHKWDARYRIEARVTDAGNREISGTANTIATYGSFWVNVEPENYFLTPGTPGAFKVQTKTYEGKPVQTAVKVDLLPGYWKDKDKEPDPVGHTDVQTAPNGEAIAQLTPPKGGSYRVRVRATTPENREVESITYVYVSGEDVSLYSEERQKQIQIIPDKKTYQPGDTAKILLITGVPKSKVLFTIEGRSLGAVRVLSLNSATTTVEVPITAEGQPDFYVSAALFHDNTLYQGTKAIRVPAADRQLSLELTSSKKQFQPGEIATYTLLAKDTAGRPVAGEFSVGVVDEAIYGIRKDTTPDIFRSFYGPGYNAVATANSLSYYFNGEAGKRRMQLAAMHRRQALAQLKPDRLVAPKVRKLFPDTAFWLANLKTDASGRGTAQFAFPDSITTWRATVRGATADTRVGSVVQKTIVRKNVILRMVAPRFFATGDEVTISAVVHNYLPEAKQAKVSLELKGLDAVEAATQQVNLPSRGEVKVDWRVKASVIGNAVLTMKALTNEESDAVEMTLPINPQGVKLALSKAGSVNAGKLEQTVSLEFPAAAVPATRNLEITVSPSIAGALFGAIDYLTQFPYGCTEQTLSSFVPNITVRKALSDLGIASDVNNKQLAEKIRAGLDRLYDFQHPDGGWGWWKTDDSSVFMTTAAVAGLGQAKAAGQQLKEGALENGVKWLRAAYDKEPRMLPDLKAYAAWALATAGAPDAKVTDDVRAKQKSLTPYGVALLGLTYEAAGNKTAATEMASLLEQSVKQNDAEAWWPGDRDTLMDFYADVTPEVTAFALKLLVHERPQSPLLEKGAVWLMNHRQEGSYWYSTKQTAMVIYGLTDYLKATGELKPDLTATVIANGKTVLTKHFQAADALSIETNKIVLPADASNTVQVTMQGSGRVYWSVRGNFYSTEQKLIKTGSVSLNLLRDYFKLTPQQDKGKIVYKLDALSGPLAIGDILAVRLTVTGSDWKYLLIEDPIPAGAEFIEKDGLYELKQKPDWWSTFFTRREFHDDRAALFDTYFGTGQKQYTYLLKIVNPGKFQVSPARVQPMYQPEFLSTTEPKLVEVK